MDHGAYVSRVDLRQRVLLSRHPNIIVPMLAFRKGDYQTSQIQGSEDVKDSCRTCKKLRSRTWRKMEVACRAKFSGRKNRNARRDCRNDARNELKGQCQDECVSMLTEANEHEGTKAAVSRRRRCHHGPCKADASVPPPNAVLLGRRSSGDVHETTQFQGSEDLKDSCRTCKKLRERTWKKMANACSMKFSGRKNINARKDCRNDARTELKGQCEDECVSMLTETNEDEDTKATGSRRRGGRRRR